MLVPSMHLISFLVGEHDPPLKESNGVKVATALHPLGQDFLLDFLGHQENSPAKLIALLVIQFSRFQLKVDNQLFPVVAEDFNFGVPCVQLGSENLLYVRNCLVEVQVGSEQLSKVPSVIQELFHYPTGLKRSLMVVKALDMECQLVSHAPLKSQRQRFTEIFARPLPSDGAPYGHVLPHQIDLI